MGRDLNDIAMEGGPDAVRLAVAHGERVQRHEPQAAAPARPVGEFDVALVDPEPKRRGKPNGAGHGEKALAVIDPKAPLDVANQFMLTHWTRGGVRLMAFWRGELWRYRSDGWQPVSTDDMRAELYRLLAAAKRPDKQMLVSVKPNMRMVSEVLDALRATGKLNDTRAAPFMLDGTALPAGGVLVVRNGYVDLATRTLHPLTPNLFAPSRADFDYEPDSGDPTQLLAFLNEIFDGDTASITLLQEYFGYVLSDENLYQKALFIVGPTRSGKGTLGNLLTALLGRAGVASPPLHKLGDTFGLAGLLNRKLILVSDARLTTRTDIANVVETLLRVIAGDSVDVARKYLPDLTSIVLPGKLVMLSNELPSFTDNSTAITGRFLILRTLHTFFGNEDPLLGRKLAKEMPQILDWALDGLASLMERGYFIEPAEAEALRETWNRTASPMGAFVKDCCVRGPDCEVDEGLLYGAYEAWCMRQHLKPSARNWFYRDLAPVVPTTKRRITEEKISKVMVRGIGLLETHFG
jgi:putative DNA primase/helicase